MDNQISNQKPADEIDLIDLFNRMGRGIKKSFNWLLNLLKSFLILIIRKSIWIILFSVAGCFAGYYFYSNTPRFYSSNMIVRSNSMNNSMIVSSINLLNNLFGSKNYDALSSLLGTTLAEVKKIRTIEAFYGIDINRDKIADYIDYDNAFSLKDSAQKRVTDVFYVRINVYDETVFLNLKDGIKRYISTNPYIIQNNDIRRIQTKSMIKEINKLDSLQKDLFFEVPKMPKNGNSQTVVLNDKESKLFHKDFIELYKKKQELEKDLILNPDPITIIQDFTQLSRVENPLMAFLKKWVIIFAILGFFTSLLWQFQSEIWNLIKNKQY